MLQIKSFYRISSLNCSINQFDLLKNILEMIESEAFGMCNLIYKGRRKHQQPTTISNSFLY